MTLDTKRHGELVTPEGVRELLLDPAVDADSFVVAVRTEPDASAAFKKAAALAQFYATRSLADGTRESYSRHWRAYLRWCALADEDPLGGGDVVAAHLAWLATGELDEDDELVLDAAGMPVQRPLTTASVDLRLAAINKAYELLGMVRPGADPFVRRVKEGIHRQLGVEPVHRKAALTLPRLKTVLEATYLPTPEVVRDLALCHLWLRLGGRRGRSPASPGTRSSSRAPWSRSTRRPAPGGRRALRWGSRRPRSAACSCGSGPRRRASGRCSPGCAPGRWSTGR